MQGDYFPTSFRLIPYAELEKKLETYLETGGSLIISGDSGFAEEGGGFATKHAGIKNAGKSEHSMP